MQISVVNNMMQQQLDTSSSSLTPILNTILSAIKLYKHPNQSKPQMFMLPDFSISCDASTSTYTLSAPSFLLQYIGILDAQTAYYSLANNTDTAQLIRGIYDNYASVGEKPLPFFMWFREGFETYVTEGYNYLDTEPAALTYRRDIPSLIYIDPDLIIPGPHPAWDNFLSQCDTDVEREILKAYLYKPFDVSHGDSHNETSNAGRQLLYIYDTGRTGKSTVARVIHKNLPHMSAALNSDNLSSQFGYSFFYGKRLLIYADCKHPGIIKNEKLHSLTGGDLVNIERKFEAPFSARIHAHIIVMSNDPPVLDIYRAHETSRVLPIRLDPSKCTDRSHYTDGGVFIGNRKFEQDLDSQFWHFIHSCKISYEKLCPNGAEILYELHFTDSKSQSDTTDIFDSIFDECIKYEPGAVLSAKDARELLECNYKNTITKSKYIYSDWRYYLEHKGKGIYGVHRVKDKIVRGYKNLKCAHPGLLPTAIIDNTDIII